MNEVIKKFEERRAELVSQSEKSNSVEEFRNLQTQIQDLNTAIEELKKVKPADERTAAVNDAEKRSADSQKFVQGKGFVPAENRSVDYSKILETREKAGQDLKEKRAAQLPMAIFGETRAVTVGESSIVVPTTFSNTINPDFNKVSTLIDSVDHLILNGGESFRQPYIKDIEIGGYTLEGENAVEAETKFDYVDILKVKATSYSEVSEELLKLPSANYADKVFQNIRTSMRMLLTKEILVGGGNNNQLVGIFSDKATAIDSSTDLEFSTVDDQTLDTIVFSYGGDENVEDPAVLILSKEDLLEFARVRTSTTLRYYDIKTQGNFGTINSVPFIINSACKPLTKATTATGAFCICYGALSGYTPDDRQTKHETIGGVVVQYFGRVENGDTISFEADIKAKDKDLFFGYWYNRIFVTIIDEAGNVYEGCRVKVTRHRYIERFVKYYHCVLEIWRV